MKLNIAMMIVFSVTIDDDGRLDGVRWYIEASCTGTDLRMRRG